MAKIPPVVTGNQVLASDHNNLLCAVVAGTYLIAGATPGTSASLTLSYGAQEAAIQNNAGTQATYVSAAAGSRLLPASQDTYVDLGFSGGYNGLVANGVYTFTSQTIGAAAPSQADNTIRLWKITTGASAITAPPVLLASTQPPLITGPLTANGRLTTGNPTSGAATTVAAGGGLASCSVALVGNDTAGVVNFSPSGTATCGAAGEMANVTFGTPNLGAFPRVVFVIGQISLGEPTLLSGLYTKAWDAGVHGGVGAGFSIMTAGAQSFTQAASIFYLVLW